MKHPNFTYGIKEQLAAATQYYSGKRITFHGPDGRDRPGTVDGVIFTEKLDDKWIVQVNFDLKKLDGTDERLWDPAWARQYYDVTDSAITWHV